MVNLVMVTHGDLAVALKETAEMLVGEQEHISMFGLHLGDSVDALRMQVSEELEHLSGQGEVLVLTDMMFGSPFNISCSLMSKFDFEHLTGINLPVLLEILSSRDGLTAKELVEVALKAGPGTLLDARRYFEEVS